MCLKIEIGYCYAFAMLQKKATKHNIQFGRRIKRMREAKDITQETLAEKVGVSLGWISRIERGINAPNLKLLGKMARVLGVKVKDLIPF